MLADILGYGPLEPLLGDNTITEVMVNGHQTVYVERYGKIEKTNIVFEDNEHLMRIIDRIVAPLGRRVDEASPMVDARLPSGYRVNATIPPLSLDGPLLTIRKFAQTPIHGARPDRQWNADAEAGRISSKPVWKRVSILSSPAVPAPVKRRC